MATANTINVTGGNGYTLALGDINLPSSTGGNTTNTLTINANSANVSTGTLLLGSYGEGVHFGGTQQITVLQINGNSNGNSTVTIGDGHVRKQPDGHLPQRLDGIEPRERHLRLDAQQRHAQHRQRGHLPAGPSRRHF
ncbi:MAG: hypothetical protein WDO13_21510 [Verrucomicrobiota bacterium]